MSKSIGLIAAFLGGAVVGGALGVLLAPQSGEETRKKIAEALEKRGIKLNDNELTDLIAEIKTVINPEEK